MDRSASQKAALGSAWEAPIVIRRWLIGGRRSAWSSASVPAGRALFSRPDSALLRLQVHSRTRLRSERAVPSLIRSIYF
jgi:hypothetical protein